MLLRPVNDESIEDFSQLIDVDSYKNLSNKAKNYVKTGKLIEASGNGVLISKINLFSN